MRMFAALGALALTMGLVSAVPALADDYGNYGGYDKYGPNYGYEKSHDYDRHAGLMSRFELIREVEQQGYSDVRDLRPSSFGGDWRATAVIDGAPVVITVDPYNGRVLSADEI